MTLGPRPRRGRRDAIPPDIQKQLQYRSLALESLSKWKKLTDEGKSKEALKVARKVLEYEAKWRKYGGKGSLT